MPSFSKCVFCGQNHEDEESLNECNKKILELFKNSQLQICLNLLGPMNNKSIQLIQEQPIISTDVLAACCAFVINHLQLNDFRIPFDILQTNNNTTIVDIITKLYEQNNLSQEIITAITNLPSDIKTEILNQLSPEIRKLFTIDVPIKKVDYQFPNPSNN